MTAAAILPVECDELVNPDVHMIVQVMMAGLQVKITKTWDGGVITAGVGIIRGVGPLPGFDPSEGYVMAVDWMSGGTGPVYVTDSNAISVVVIGGIRQPLPPMDGGGRDVTVESLEIHDRIASVAPSASRAGVRGGPHRVTGRSIYGNDTRSFPFRSNRGSRGHMALPLNATVRLLSRRAVG
jgi:hypothetical protein